MADSREFKVPSGGNTQVPGTNKLLPRTAFELYKKQLHKREDLRRFSLPPRPSKTAEK